MFLQEHPAQPKAWYEIVGGILLIPSTIITIYNGYLQAKHLRLDLRKKLEGQPPKTFSWTIMIGMIIEIIIYAGRLPALIVMIFIDMFERLLGSNLYLRILTWTWPLGIALCNINIGENRIGGPIIWFICLSVLIPAAIRKTPIRSDINGDPILACLSMVLLFHTYVLLFAQGSSVLAFFLPYCLVVVLGLLIGIPIGLALRRLR